jgi:hypothetical protein
VTAVREKMKKIVQINFKFKNPKHEVEKHWLKHAHAEEIYLFLTAFSAEASYGS